MLRSNFLAREVITADNQIRDLVEKARYCRPEPNYQNINCEQIIEQQYHRNVLANAANRRSITRDLRIQNDHHHRVQPDGEVLNQPLHQQ